MFRRLQPLTPLAALALTAALSSCHIGPHGMDFSPVTDRFAEVQNDEVIIESDTSGGSFAVPTPVDLVTSSAPAAAPAAAAPAPAAPKPLPTTSITHASGTYTVKAGDTLNGVARRHNTTAAAIASANGIAPTAMLKIGQQLRLPAAGKAVAAAPAAAKPAAKQQPAKPLAKATAPAGKAGRHTVQPGETLYAIARKHKVSPAALMQANKLTPQTAGKLAVGATLTIPAK